MAIDRMKKLTILCPVSEGQRLLRTLHELEAVEITDLLEQDPAADKHLDRPKASTEEIDRELQRLGLIIKLIDTLAPVQQGFIAGLAPVPLVVTQKELLQVRNEFDLDELYLKAEELDGTFRRAERRISEIESEIAELEPHRDLPFVVGDLRSSRRVKMLFGELTNTALGAIASDPEAPGTMALELVVPGLFHRKEDHPPAPAPKAGDRVPVLVAYTPDVEAAARQVLLKHGFDEVSLPQVDGKIRDRLRELQADEATAKAEMAQIRGEVEEMARHRRPLLILKSYWESRKRLALAEAATGHGRWVQVVSGFIREKDLGRLEEALKTHEGATVAVEDPAPGDAPPISLSLSERTRPIQMLVNLFGVPQYQTFDPSPFIIFTFLLFFGICFSDVGYGSMLVALSLYIMYRARPYPGIYNFAKLLLYGGLSTLVFGFVLGSWFGDLYDPKYLGEGNLMASVMEHTKLIDPLQKPIVLLLVALAIGMVNQLYGVALKMYSAFLRGDRKEAIYDGLLWLIILPGFVVLIAGMFAPVPRPLYWVGVALFAIGAVGLVLTQGRDQKNPVSRLITGVVSLYGIVGSYGLTAFIGDTMSYCRLLALALTTGIVALSFNMMADLLRPIPYVGTFLFIAVLVAAHVFNFLISVLGAFVHSMRLIFVEFFGRFYQTGARPFRPLGFDSSTAILKKES